MKKSKTTSAKPRKRAEAKQSEEQKQAVEQMTALSAAGRRAMQKLIASKVIASAATPREQQVLPTGIDVLDHYLFACGGIPAGERGLTEVFGGEGSMKSSLVDTLIGASQRRGVLCFLADTEHAREESRSRDVFGIRWDELGNYMSDGDDSIEHVLESIQNTLAAIPAGERGLIAWDSFAETPTREEVKEGAATTGYDRRAGIISRALRWIIPALVPKNTALVIVNQPRTKIGTVYGNPTTTPGGQSIKSCASLRVQMFASQRLKTGNEETGRLVTVVAEKSRFSGRRKVSLRMDYADGFNDEWSTLDLAKTLGMVPKDARGAKALAKALEELARVYPGFGVAASSPVDAKARAERADKLADMSTSETAEPIEQEEA